MMTIYEMSLLAELIGILAYSFKNKKLQLAKCF